MSTFQRGLRSRRARSLRGLVVLGLLALTALPAKALTVEYQLTSRATELDGRTFRVDTRDVDGMKEFTLRVQANKEPLSPFLFGDLKLRSGDELAADVRVEPERVKEGAKYRFRVSPSLTASSRFTFRENAWAMIKDSDGRSRPEMMIGGKEYWFRLSDFARP